MITNEQADRLLQLVRDVDKAGRRISTCLDWAIRRNELVAQIKANKQTNGDKWRSMSDEQIAEIIAADGCCTCPAIGINSNCGNSELGCKSTIVKWLKQEAK